MSFSSFSPYGITRLPSIYIYFLKIILISYIAFIEKEIYLLKKLQAYHISLRFSDIYFRFGDRPINKRHQATVTTSFYLSTTISHSPGQRRRTHARATVFITA